jgi:hypothetical protein
MNLNIDTNPSKFVTGPLTLEEIKARLHGNAVIFSMTVPLTRLYYDQVDSWLQGFVVNALGPVELLIDYAAIQYTVVGSTAVTSSKAARLRCSGDVNLQVTVPLKIDNASQLSQAPAPLYRCPGCCSLELEVRVEAWCQLTQSADGNIETDDNTVHDHSHHFDEASQMYCATCGFSSTVRDFTRLNLVTE